MLLLTALGPLPLIRAAADEFDRHDPSPALAVSWYEEGPSRFRLEVYAPTDQDAESAIAIIGAAAPELHVNVEPIDENANWVARSLDGLPPVFAGRFAVGGAHVLGRLHGGRKRIWIEASEAFGTGHHGTTAGCLAALERRLRSGRPPRAVADVGAGSGLLAIAAAKAGANALAIEIDPRAAAIARENAARNRVGRHVAVIAGDAARHISGRRFDLIFANILMRPLLRLAPAIAAAAAPGGTVLLSGLLHSQARPVRQAYEGRGLLFQRWDRRDAWSTLAFKKPR